MTNVVEVVGVNKVYRRWRRPAQHAVRDLDLQVDHGGVFGFLGPNGSGKTTTIRLLLGLARADSGSMKLLGRSVPDELPQVIGRIGSLVETPLFFPTFSGRQNLSLLAQASRIPETRVEEMLELVDLRERAGDMVKAYSLGMKQRLGIAAALLKNPELLILDEPGNGLDAAGIREIRELIVRLGGSGVTVLLSSHQLSEVQQVCDRVAIMSKGQVIAAGSVADLVRSGSSGDFRVRVDDPTGLARAALERHGFSVTAELDHLRVGGVKDPARVTQALAQASLYLSELTPIAADLESVFLQITGDEETAPSGTHSAPRQEAS